MNTCFNSSDPVAVNATLLYDDNTEEGHLWSIGGQSAPLPPCSASSTPPDSRCLVCVDQIVFAICRNLTRVKMVMEAGGHQVKISKSDCPKPPSDDAFHWQLLVYITTILLVGVLLFIYWKCCRKSKKQRGTISPKTLSHMEQGRDSDSDEEQKLANLQESCDLRSCPERNGKALKRKETTEGESLARTDQTP